MMHDIFMGKTFVIKTHSTIKLTIGHFYGGIAHDYYGDSFEPHDSAIGGYGFNISWEVE